MDMMTDEQKKIVEYTKGLFVVGAIPGSGKTTTLLNKVKYVITKKRFSPSEILLLTFSKSAAKTMSDKLSVDGIKGVKVRTIHGLANEILTVEKSRFVDSRQTTIYTDKEISLGLDYVTSNMRNKYSKTKVKGILNGDITNFSQHSIEADIVKRFESFVKKSHGTTYGLMLKDFLALFEDGKIDSHFRHYRLIMVDEAQDINPIQYQIIYNISKILNTYNNSDGCFGLIGDPDQRIYGWRGVDDTFSKIIHDRSFNGRDCEVFALSKNFRSREKIFKSALEISGGNDFFFASSIDWCVDKKDSVGDIFIIEADNVFDQVSSCLRWNKDILVLSRTNAVAEKFYEEAKEKDLPVELYGKDVSFWGKDVYAAMWLSLFRLVLDPYDKISFCVAAPALGIDRKNVVREIDNLSVSHFATDGMGAFEAFKKIRGIHEEFKPCININSQLCLIIDIFSSKLDVDVDIVENMRSCAHIISDFCEFYGIETVPQLFQFLSEENSSQSPKETTGLIKVMTAHSAKGMEADAVFILGANDNEFPLRRGDQDEEMRLLYVAMTRAVKQLYLVKYTDELSSFLLNSQTIRGLCETDMC